MLTTTNYSATEAFLVAARRDTDHQGRLFTNMTEWDAAAYAERSQMQEAMAAEVLSLLHFQGNERVLDVGCGDGRITSRVAERVPSGSVVGIDASTDMIRFASEQHAANRPNLRFQAVDARELPFADEFEAVVSFNALHWIPDQDVALRSICRAMKPGTRAQIRLVPKGRRKSLEDVLEETRHSAKWAGYFETFRDPYLHLTPNEYGALAESNGFHVLSVQTADKSWDFKARQTFFAAASVTFVEWTRRLPDAEKPAFITDVLDSYQSIACERPGEENTFKFYQMDITLQRAI